MPSVKPAPMTIMFESMGKMACVSRLLMNSQVHSGCKWRA